MAKYFTITQGLRGCYMPDQAYTIQAKTRRELKSALQWEADSIRDAGGIGMNKRAIAWLANAAWKESHKRNPSIFDFVAPYRWQYQDSRPYGLFCSVSNRSDYLEYVRESEQ